MNAILLAAGFGTRLNCEKTGTPKCLIQINGKTMLEYWIEKLSNVGVKKFLINTHFMSEEVHKFLDNHPKSADIFIFNEEILLGTAQTVLKNVHFFTSNTFIVHVDNYCEDNLLKMVKFHTKRPKNCIATMLTFRSKEPEKCGIIQQNNQNILTNFYEKWKNPPGNIANGAIYLVSKKFSNFISSLDNPKDLSLDVISKMKNIMYCYNSNTVFFDIGTPRSLEQTRSRVKFLEKQGRC